MWYLTRKRVMRLSRYYSPTTFLGFALAVTGFTCVVIIKAALFEKHTGHWTDASPWICTVMWILGVIFIWAIWFLKHSHRNRNSLAWALPFMQNSYHMLLVSALVYRIISEVATGQCDDGRQEDFGVSFAPCNVFQNVELVQPKYMITLMVLPLISYCLIQETHYLSIAFSWTTAVGALLGCGIYLNSGYIITPVVVYALASALILYDSNRQKHEMIQLILTLKETLLENERLQEDTRASELRAMIGNVAHDLKTPLTSILSGIELTQEIIRSWEVTLPEGAESAFLRKAQESANAVKACLNSMAGANTFMTMTINRCLDYTKASKGVKLVPKIDAVNLAEALDYPTRLVRDIQSQTEIKYHPIATNICTHVMTDKQWLVENLLCLLSNAVKYSSGGGVELRVFHTPSSSTQPSMLQFQVEDTGLNLTEEAMSTLFAPFKQAQRLAGGTGLGLYSLAKRVEALQGQYGVSKRPDGAQGSLFWFSIPYHPDHKYAQGSILVNSSSFQPSESFELSVNPEASAFKVLVVDDAPTVLKMSSMLLTRKGHHVHQAVNGAEALKALLRVYDERQGSFTSKGTDDAGLAQIQPYDVVLMDLQMPVMDGIEAIRRLRAAESQMSKKTLSRRGPTTTDCDIETGICSSSRSDAGTVCCSVIPQRYHCFVIALSANSDSETAAQAMAAGADTFISKPFTYDTFMQAMSRRPVSLW